ncbi:MAG: PQQ-binding-like beta-propeller repeat protein [Lachnospiraceae bacterium]
MKENQNQNHNHRKKGFKQRILGLCLAMLLVCNTGINNSLVHAEEPDKEKVQSGQEEQITEKDIPTVEKDEPTVEKDEPAINTQVPIVANDTVESIPEPVTTPAVLGNNAPIKDIGLGVTVTLYISGYDSIIQTPVKVTMPDTYRTLQAYGLTSVDAKVDPGYFTPLHVLAQYCETTYGDVANTLTCGTSGFLMDIAGMKGGTRQATDTSLMYAVNHAYPKPAGSQWGYGIAECPITGGDFIAIYDMWYSSHASGAYSWFTESSKTAVAEQAFTVSLQTMDGMSGAAGNSGGAKLQVLDAQQQEITDPQIISVGKTDNMGRGTVTIHQAGTYTITAERMGTNYDSTGNPAYDLSKPYCEVTVTPAQVMTDEASVASAKEELSLGDVSAVTGDIQLPATGNHKTSIQWSSSNPTALSIQGAVKRPVDSNTKVILTATITKGTAITTKEIEVTIQGYTTALKSLIVNPGTLEYTPTVGTYTVYVPEACNEIKVTAETNADASYFKINGSPIYSVSGTKQVPLQANQDTSFKIEVLTKGTWGTTTITVKHANQGPALPELPNSWGQHLGNAMNNAATSAATPTENAGLLWESQGGVPDAWGTGYAGTPILVNGKIYVVRNQQIQILNATTGEKEQAANLISNAGYYSYITYGEGKIFVPLENGTIQCFNAVTLESLYVTQLPGLGLQGLSSVYYKAGKIYVGFTNGAFTDEGLKGRFVAYDTVDIDKDRTDERIPPAWSYGQSSYYGGGAVAANQYIIFAGDDGKVVAVDSATGEKKSEFTANGKIRCSLVYEQGYIWFTTQKGNLYKLSVDDAGSLTQAAMATLPASSKSSPVVTGGKVYVTGGTFTGGFLAVYDTSLMLLADIKTTAEALTPTVSTAYENVYVYFAQNATPGSVYVAKVTGNNKITLETLYTPKHANYCMSNIVIGEDGTLYYGNDSGYLFALGKQTQEVPPLKQDPTQEPPKGEQSELKPEVLPGLTDPISTQGGLVLRGGGRNSLADKLVAGNEISKTSGRIAQLIGARDAEGKQSLTIKNAPKKLDSQVFTELAKYPKFRLILDCGGYTLSILGADIQNQDSTLSTQIEKKENTLSEEIGKKLGTHQQFEFVQEGVLPGTVTVVYQTPENLKNCKEIYLYYMNKLSQPTKAIVEKGYTMFALDNNDDFILSDTPVGEIGVVATDTTAKKIQAYSQEPSQASRRFPMWIWVMISVLAGGVIGGAVVGNALRIKHKKERTWDI